MGGHQHMTGRAGTDAASDPGEPSVAELVTRLSEQTSRLVRDEMRLAQAEMQAKARHGATGIGLFSGAGLLAFFGIATLIATAVLALAQVVPAWAAAGIVAIALFVAAGVAALSGKKQVEQATPKPERTIESLQRDVDEVKGHLQT